MRPPPITTNKLKLTDIAKLLTSHGIPANASTTKESVLKEKSVNEPAYMQHIIHIKCLEHYEETIKKLDQHTQRGLLHVHLLK